MNQTPAIPSQTEQTNSNNVSVEDILNLMDLKSLSTVDGTTYKIRKDELYMILQFIADCFNDMSAVANKYKELSDHFKITELYDEDGIRLANCSRLVLKLSNKKEVDKLKSAKTLAPILKKYVDLQKYLNDNLIR